VVNAARQAGGVLGVALLGTLVSGSSLAAGLPAALAVAAGAFFAGAALILMSGPAARVPAGPPSGTAG
jgi:hypothetical protein